MKTIKEIAHCVLLLAIVTVCGMLVYWDEWEIIRNYKDVTFLAFIWILMAEIIFYGGRKK
jgi:hypothetical protein